MVWTYYVPIIEPEIVVSHAPASSHVQAGDVIAVDRRDDALELVLTASTGMTDGDMFVVDPGGSLLPGGYAGRALTVSHQEPGQIVVTADSAPLDEIFDQVSVRSSGLLTPGDEPTALRLRYSQNKGYRAFAGGERLTAARAGLAGERGLFSCKDADGNSRDDLVYALDVSLKFPADEGTHSISMLGMSSRQFFLNVGIWTEPVINVSGRVGAELSCSLHPEIAGTDLLIPVPGVPFVTVDIGPDLNVDVGAEGSSLIGNAFIGVSTIRSVGTPLAQQPDRGVPTTRSLREV